MPNYYIWTMGCQMNKAESQQIAGYFECLGFKAVNSARSADVILLNTCVIRQSAEDKVKGMLGYIQSVKSSNPNASILVTGCFVNSNISDLHKNYVHVDLFFKPGNDSDLCNWLEKKEWRLDRNNNHSVPANVSPTAYVPIIQGCNNFCSYCIVPYRRGRERSYPIEDITDKVSMLVQRGVKEVTLLGQNVNSYGNDLPSNASLSVLLNKLNDIPRLERIRFLTNHPKDITEELIQTVASLDKVCRHINLPIQSGDDTILKAMRRSYTSEQYLSLIAAIRKHIPDMSISTDIIVGFPDETDSQFDNTFNLIKQIRFDAVHAAMYSTRPGTIAARKYNDNVPPQIKKGRFDKVETLQAEIAGEINALLQGKMVEVLVEGNKKDKWFGRCRSDKLVFFESPDNCLGQLLNIEITRTSPWSLTGNIK